VKFEVEVDFGPERIILKDYTGWVKDAAYRSTVTWCKKRKRSWENAWRYGRCHANTDVQFEYL